MTLFALILSILGLVLLILSLTFLGVCAAWAIGGHLAWVPVS